MHILKIRFEEFKQVKTQKLIDNFLKIKYVLPVISTGMHLNYSTTVHSAYPDFQFCVSMGNDYRWRRGEGIAPFSPMVVTVCSHLHARSPLRRAIRIIVANDK